MLEAACYTYEMYGLSINIYISQGTAILLEARQWSSEYPKQSSKKTEKEYDTSLKTDQG